MAPEILAECRRILAREPSSCVIFVQRRNPPRVIYREDPPIDAILAPAATFHDAVSRSRDPEHAVYVVTSAVLRGASVRQLLVRTIGAPQLPEPPARVAPITTLVPHRGPFENFRVCMHYIAHQWARCEKTQVYFDEDLSDQHAEWLARNPAIEAYQSSRPGAGPYPGRHYLASRASTPWIMFQDSDDAPCADRVARLSAAFSDGDLLGSHEVRLDDFREIIYPVRYPLDVNDALVREAGHALLHPTSMVRKSAYVQSGGFSTHRVMGSDTQFLLRAHFSMQIRNLDEFLYVKRDRAGSLTRSPRTMLGCPERLRLQQLWVDAFRRTDDGQAILEQTALAAEHHGDVAIERIKQGDR
ncbi:hypothetical protein SAMN05421805_102513 [Saccharopolyspora antimicrobica]|uniref:Glycosyl transferase family 2 n=2 Tax=Saccharopolyspora antimicrobica TaxID=455193 RepID=A0A1I4W3V9_9PSEU|nr:hypothetical protein ATL45_5472 [Saccharopolyspora antimicrobica]SFN07950.1 hypothetical protein SAMN05421805_102513 [Saccharopolyspora antimicrobica]